MHALLLALLLLMYDGALLTAQPYYAGQQAPRLKLGTVLQGRWDAKTPPAATVIEFWATWCSHCRAAIPHLNRLADQFKDRPITFLSLTSEDEVHVRSFLRENHVAGVVALDPGAAIARLLSAGLPSTVLLDRSGRIAAITYPTSVTPEVLESLLLGRPLKLPWDHGRDVYYWRSHATYFGNTRADDAALARLVIKPESKQLPHSYTKDQFESAGSSVAELVAFAYDASFYRVEVPEALKYNFYSVQAWVPPTRPESLKPFLRTALSAALGIDVRRQPRVVDALVLRGSPGKLRFAAACEASWNVDFSAGKLTGCVTLDRLRSITEAVLRKVVLTDDRSDGKYEIEMTWDPSKPGSFEAAVEGQLGLQLLKEQRSIEVLVVTYGQDSANSGPSPP